MKKISVIIPVRNEEKNVTALLRQLDRSLASRYIRYEAIVIDDYSTDNTEKVVKKLVGQLPIRYFLKKGKQGKAYSLLEGFAKAKYETVAMIDADLQYSPRYIPEMLKRIEEGADIVIADRVEYNTHWFRKFSSRVFSTLFAEKLHGFQSDVQSGLKVFRKDILSHIHVSPSSWTFDLEFLVQARSAGYRIADLPIAFEKRHSGKSKINFVKSAFEIAVSALMLKFVHKATVPFHPTHARKKGAGFHYNGAEFVHHTNLPFKDSAFSRFSFHQLVVLGLLLAGVTLGLIFSWHATLVVLIALLSLLYFADLLFNLFLVYQSYFKEPEIEIKDKDIATLSESSLPTYTILCPLYKEWQVLPQFIAAMSTLDYPKNKLQVMLLLEKDDKETVKQINAMSLPYYFDVVIVPHSQPKTKPKALNYGLKKTTGEYVVIYDAEDVPDPLQLKKAILAFHKAKQNVICIQAKLNFYNPSQNVLTRLFTIEYSLWFDLVLTGLQSIHAPIPLGGTSNHFRTIDIISLKRWDPFNVTEDADLGMRIVKRGYKTALVNSYTMEEANSDMKNWFTQRSRWIKGYIQTYFVHMRHPREFLTSWRSPHFITFQLIIGAKILSMVINPLMWLMTIAYFGFKPYTGEFIQSLYLTPIFYMAAFSLVVGNFLYMYYYMLGAAKRNQWELVPFAVLTPLYWIGMSAAAAFAVWEFFTRPHYWHKTLHGLHLKPGTRPAEAQRQDISLSPAA